MRTAELKNFGQYVARISPLLLLWLGVAAIVVDSDIRAVERNMTQAGTAYLNQLDKEMIRNEATLMAFSTVFGTLGETMASRYAGQLMAANPQIFSLEIVQTASKNQPGSFAAGKTHDRSRAKENAFNHPLTLMRRILSGPEKVPALGLPMNESRLRRAPVASPPFRLAKDDLEYAVFFPVSRPLRRGDSAPSPAAQNESLLGMVIDASRLANIFKFQASKGETVIVYHRAFWPEDQNGQLLKMAGKARSAIETAIFPAFIFKYPLATTGEPFALVVKKQVGWSDLSQKTLALITLLAFGTSLTLVAYLRDRQRSRVAQRPIRLWHGVDHDPLTGLPDGTLLMFRAAQLQAQMLSQNMSLAVLLLDFDEFKKVNDLFGRESGDELLRFVANRLCAAVRTDDTVARTNSDEFVILIENVDSMESLDFIKQKIQQKLSGGFLIAGQLIHVRASMGIAILPGDGDSMDALLKQARIRMCADKKARRVKLHLV
ncbi:MAG: GGDEF domain-containing protein [Sulfuricella sp.]